ncbi:MAG: hypothetical protein GQ564_10455 [Bacteroidales bacterium]|nr:hypothetical protein [Bacteroidales bacterium]
MIDEQKIRQKEFENRLNDEQCKPFIKDVFPFIDKITIRLKFQYTGAMEIENGQQIIKTREDKFYFRIPCINPECIYSDLNLINEINSLINFRETNMNGKKLCNGWQDYVRYKAKNYHCQTHMDYEIEIKYHNDENIK